MTTSDEAPQTLRVVEYITGKIARGEWKKGDRIDSPAVISLTCKCGPAFVYPVIRRLVSEGVLYRAGPRTRPVVLKDPT